MYLKRLIESGYPKEEAIKALFKKFDNLKGENDIIENWIKDIMNQMKTQNLLKRLNLLIHLKVKIIQILI